jgi:hypothetical protein
VDRRHLRRRQTIKHRQKQHEPEDCVYCLHWELGSSKQEREERYMTCDRQGSKGAKESAIVERNQAERDDDKKNSLLVNMPAEQEGSIPTQGDRTNESFPRWFVQ